MKFSCDGGYLSLVRNSTKGRPYTHGCRKEVLEMVIDHFERHPLGQTASDCARAITEVHHTSVRVAFLFLVEVGAIVHDLSGKGYTAEPDCRETGWECFHHLHEVGRI